MTRDEQIEIVAGSLFEQDHNSESGYNEITRMLFGAPHITYEEVMLGIDQGHYEETALSGYRDRAKAIIEALRKRGLWIAMVP